MNFEGNNGGFYMPVAPAYSGGGYGNGSGFFGGDWAWIILLLLIGGNGWGFGGGFGGGMMPWLVGGMNGGFGIDYLYPWLNNSQHLSDGFRDQALQSSVNSLANSVTAGFGDVQLGIAGINQNLCQTGNAVTGAVRDGFYSAEIAANGRQMADMQQNFALQSQMSQCCCDQKAGLADVKYTIASEECATRQADAGNTQRILDKLCQIEQDTLKARLDAKDDTINQLRSELLYARGQASQIDQTARILAGQAAEIDGVYNRLKNCPVGTVPVYGNQPIFTCQNSGYGYGYAA